MDDSLKFGTSGLRGPVAKMTDEEVYACTRGFIRFLMNRGECREGDVIAVGGDLRPSTPRIIAAVCWAITDSNLEVDYCGFLPSPALAYYAIRSGKPSIMVTGSHIPADRNGIKFTKRSGEVLKSDENEIREQIRKVKSDSTITVRKEPVHPPFSRVNRTAVAVYMSRYIDAFPRNCLSGVRIALYQHSSVGRDIIRQVLQKLGAEVIAPTERIRAGAEEIDLRSETFIPVDTENITPTTQSVLRHLAEIAKPDFVISADGDADRPLFADECGEFLPGDKLGYLALRYLMRNAYSCFAALPISSNDGVISDLQRMGVEVELTPIGSPYIIAAMNDAPQHDLVVGWEANGGFLLNTRVNMPSGTLEPLPTRDSILPLLTAILLIKESGKTASRFIREELPARFNVAAITDRKIPGAENYTSDLGREIIRSFSPSDPDIRQVDFSDTSNLITYADGRKIEIDKLDPISIELRGIRERLSGFFAAIGLKTPIRINYLDGVRIHFVENNVIYHMRPSGNAPEFRSYVTADNLKLAREIVEQGSKCVIPSIVECQAKSGS